jgi:hypothetical protein
MGFGIRSLSEHIDSESVGTLGFRNRNCLQPRAGVDSSTWASCAAFILSLTMAAAIVDPTADLTMQQMAELHQDWLNPYTGAFVS